jgi:predicted phosphoribosyltransferase
MRYSNQGVFVDRHEAGIELAGKLLDEPLIAEASRETLLVLSIPRGGVVVGAAMAEVLGCSHNVIVVKKIGFPGQPELAIGAVAEDGLVIWDEEMSPYCQRADGSIEQSLALAQAKVEQYTAKFRSNRLLDLAAKTVILTDDGIATGETMKAAICWANARGPAQPAKSLIVAVPVCSPRTAEEIERMVDRLVCIARPEMFFAVGQFYWDFSQISDNEVLAYLKPHGESAPLPA